MADTDFVGRAEHIARILGPVSGPGRPGTFFDVEGIPGIGKTRLIEQLASKVREEEGVAIRIDGGDFEARGRRFGARTSDEAAEFRQFRTLLRGVLDALSEDEHIADVLNEEIADVQNYLDERSQPSRRLRAGFDGGGRAWAPSEPGEGSYDADELLGMATEAATLLARNLAARRVRLLLLVDDLHLLAGRPLGQWVMELLGGIKGADVVVTHQRFRDSEDPGIPSRAVQLPLGNLDRDDVEAYLKSHPGVGPDVAGIVDHVWEFTAGHPQALVLVADLVEESKGAEDPVRLIRQLGALQGGQETQLKALIDRILAAIEDEELRDALYNVCVTRHFDGPLLERLLKVDERHAQTLIDRLRHYSFVQESAVEHSFLAISDFVRRIGENHLDATRRQAIHMDAARYYHDLIVQEAAEDETSYQSWYRYEDPEFQALERDWLYHISRLTGRSRQNGRIGIARIFLDAVWWWGNYTPFPFCEEILADWSDVTSIDDEDRTWGEQLRTLYDKYPKGWRKSDVPQEQWTEVRRALRYLWDHCRFGEPWPDEREMRHIRGILALFLADAARYVDPGDKEADAQLDDAVEQFAANDDEWDIAWAEYTRADLAVSRGQTELAISLARQSAQSHPDLDDHELVANLHRVCADAYWANEDPGAALDAYARAMAHAYRFQVKAIPDDYTDAFQQEMIERSMGRLVHLHADDRDEGHAVLRSACTRIRAFFGPYWREVGADPTARGGLDAVRALDEGRQGDAGNALFPARPAIADLRRHGSKYALVCGDVTHQMAAELAQPPGTPLPPAEG